MPLVYRKGATVKVKATLNAVSAKLTQDELMSLDIQVLADRKDPASVAKTWLRDVGLR